MNAKQRIVTLAVIAALADTGAVASPSLAPLAELQLGDASAGLALDQVKRKAYATNYTSGTLSIVDVDTQTVESVDVGANPRRFLFNANLQRAYIVNDTTPGTLTVFDAAGKQVVATIPVGNRPRSIAADFQYGEVYVANQDSNTMTVIDTATNTVKATVNVGSTPFMGDVNGRLGRIYVVSALDRSVHVIDQATKAVLATVTTGRSPNAATVDESTGKVYVNNVTDRTVQIIEPTTNRVAVTLPAGGGSNFGSISAVYRRYYLPNQSDFTVTAIDTDTDSIVATIPVGASPQQVVVDNTVGNLYVVNRLGNSVSVIDERTENTTEEMAVGINPWRAGVAMGRVFALNENGNRSDSMSIISATGPLAGTAVVTEYYNAEFDHYFHTSNGPENRLLQDGQYGNTWNRTFDFFRAWNAAGPDRVQVCRFFSEAFVPKSSHAYIADGSECQALKSSSDWHFEGMAYYVALPDAQGTCASGTVPLYRIYNNGMGGAPNHRITANRTLRDAMVSAGWIAEGTGEDTVYACVPSLRGDEVTAVSIK